MTDLSIERIEHAAHTIDPIFRDTPQFTDPQLGLALHREVQLKVETMNPLGSFKGRGADFLARELDPRRRLVCATAGNFGQAIAYAARTRAGSSRTVARRRSRRAPARSGSSCWSPGRSTRSSSRSGTAR